MYNKTVQGLTKLSVAPLLHNQWLSLSRHPPATTPSRHECHLCTRYGRRLYTRHGRRTMLGLPLWTDGAVDRSGRKKNETYHAGCAGQISFLPLGLLHH
jgi:hypothetical protein